MHRDLAVGNIKKCYCENVKEQIKLIVGESVCLIQINLLFHVNFIDESTTAEKC